MASSKKTGDVHFRARMLNGDHFLMKLQVGHPTAFQAHAATGFGAENDTNATPGVRLADEA